MSLHETQNQSTQSVNTQGLGLNLSNGSFGGSDGRVPFSAFGANFTLSQVDNGVAAAQTAFDEMSKSVLKASPEYRDYSVSVTTLDGNDQVALGSVITVLQHRTGKSTFFITVLSSAKKAELPVVTLSLNGKPHNTQLLPGQIVDADYVKIARRKVTLVLGLKEDSHENLVNAGHLVLPEDFTWNKEDSSKIQGVIFNALEKCGIRLNNMLGQAEFDISRVDFGNTKLTLVPTVQPGNNVVGVDGTPARADCTIVMQSSNKNKRQNGQQVINGQEQDAELSKLTCFVSLEPQSIPNPHMIQPGMPLPKPFVGNIVITSVQEKKVGGLEGAILAMSSINAITAGGQWFHLVDTVNVNIGALNIWSKTEVDHKKPVGEWGQPIEQTRDMVKNMQLLDKFLDRRPVVSIDVLNTGAHNSALVPFAQAAYGDMAANDRVIQACNNLTNGRFSRRFQGGQVASRPVAIVTGYYTDERGVKRDTRAVDFSYIASREGAKSPELMKQWLNTFTAMSEHEQIRIDDRKIIESNLISGSTKYMGMGARVTLSPHFAEALFAALAESGLTFNSISSLSAVQQTSSFDYSNMFYGGASPLVNNNTGMGGSFAPYLY